MRRSRKPQRTPCRCIRGALQARLMGRAAIAWNQGLLWLLLLGAAHTVCAMTTPDEVLAASDLRDALRNRSVDWRNALDTWTCPTDPASSDSECDICSSDWSGNWEHLHCRGFAGPYGEGSVGDKDGLITTVHITDVNLDGPVPRQFCGLKHLREFDLDGGQLTGPFPRWLMEPWPKGALPVAAPEAAANASSIMPGMPCMTNLQELDLSYNRLTGTIPPEIGQKVTLQEFKVESNFLYGTLPEELGSLPKLWRIRVQRNKLSGTIPESFAQLAPTLNELWIDNNDFEGDLSALGTTRLVYVQVQNNQKLCGMVPASVRYAHGYNPAGTRLGQPC